MMRRFTVIETFHSEEQHRNYWAGDIYEADDEEANELVDKWIAEGEAKEVTIE
jgi:hypothetical protein